MYNEELEALIDVALTDGVLTEKEKQILFKKAQSMGINLDEFEMVLDARLVKLKKAEQEKTATFAPKSNKLGDIKKCPACGAMVQSFHGVCPDCGYAFENVAANSSVITLTKTLEKCINDGGNPNYEKMAPIIARFPIPTVKADIMELIILIQTQLSSLKGQIYTDTYRNACIAKFKECSLKATYYFPNDNQLQNLIQETNNIIAKLEKNRKTTNLIRIIIGAIMIVLALLVGYGIWKQQWHIICRISAISLISSGLLWGGILLILIKKG